MAWIFVNRLTGASLRQRMPDETLPGLWIIQNKGKERLPLKINGVEVKEWDYLVDDSEGKAVSDDPLFGKTSFPTKSFFPSKATIHALDEIRSRLKDVILWQDLLKINPLAQDCNEQIKLLSFEEDMLKFKTNRHLQSIYHRPRKVLNTVDEPLHVSIVKQIASRSIQYLACHSEDWQRRTLSGVQPKRVLARIVEDHWDIYENRIAARFVDRTVSYLYKRLDILNEYANPLEDALDWQRNINNAQFRLAQRLTTLWGSFQETEDSLSLLREHRGKLQKLLYKMLAFMRSELYIHVPRNNEVGTALRETNILISDQHYRHLPRLWKLLGRASSSKSPQTSEEIYHYRQAYCRNFNQFALLLTAKALEQFHISAEGANLPQAGGGPIHLSRRNGPTGKFLLSIDQNDAIVLKDENDGVIPFRIIPLATALANPPKPKEIKAKLEVITKATSQLEVFKAKSASQEVSVILYPASNHLLSELPDELRRQLYLVDDIYTDNNILKIPELFLLPVSPLDLGSVERLGRVLRWWLDGIRYLSFPPQVDISPNLQQLIRMNNIGLHRVPNSPSRMLVTKKWENKDWQNLKLELRKVAANIQSPLINHLKDAQEIIKNLSICPICSSESFFNFLQPDNFCCECNSCGSKWGTQATAGSQKCYPFLHVQHYAALQISNDGEIIDKKVGCDVLKV